MLGGVLSGTLPLNFGFEFGIRALELKFNVEFRIGELEFVLKSWNSRSSARESALRHPPAHLRVRVREVALNVSFEFRLGELEFASKNLIFISGASLRPERAPKWSPNEV